jgi:hypothetical protein
MNEERPTKQVAIWMQPSLAKWLRQYAFDNDMSQSVVVRQLLEAKRREAEPPSPAGTQLSTGTCAENLK